MPRQKKIAFQGEPGANSHLACNEVFPAAEAASDEPTADLLTQRMQIHEKTAWMLRALLA